jgi:Tfp pilus assembly protein PilF
MRLAAPPAWAAPTLRSGGAQRDARASHAASKRLTIRRMARARAAAVRAVRPPPAAVEREPRAPWIAAALGILLLVLWAYAPLRNAGWVWDDIDVYITNNAVVKAPDGIRDIWLGFYRNPAKGDALVVKTYQYYPLVFSSFWLEHRLFGLNPAPYHLLNVLLHLVNVVLVFRLARRLAIPGAPFVAALFALHPMMVESVAWVSERKNVLSGLFYLSAFLAWLRWDDGGRRARLWLAASFVLFVGALLSKTVTATFPVAVGLALIWRHGTVRPRDLVALLPFVAVAIGLGWFSVHLERYAVGAAGDEFSQTLLERCTLIAPRAFAFYALKTLWPHPITFIYPRWDPHASDPTAYAWVIGCLAAGAALLVLRRRVGNGPLLLALFSLVTLAPALGFVPVYPHRYSWVADHFAYLGALGFFALVASAAVALTDRIAVPLLRRRFVAGVAVVALVGCTALSRRAVESYRDEETLWADTLAESPDAWIAMINLGINYMSEPPPRTEDRMAKAMALFQRAEAYDLGRLQALTNEGHWYKRKRQYDEAAQAFRRALALKPDRAKTRQDLADLRIQQSRAALADGRTTEARQACLDGMGDLGPDPRLMGWCARLVAAAD